MAGTPGSQPSEVASEAAVTPQPEPQVKLPSQPMPAGSPAPDPAADLAAQMNVAPAQAPDDPAAQLAQEMNAAPEESTTSQVLKGAGRVLDYGGGLVRTGLAGAAGAAQALATGEPDKVTPDDVTAALKGQAPSSAEYLKRFGAKEQSHWVLPGLGSVSDVDMAGAALDIATDPLTAITKLVKEYPVLSRFINKGPIANSIAAVVANPVGIMSEGIGRSTYRGSFGKLAAKIGSPEAEEVAGQLLNRGGAPIGPQAVEAAAQKISGEMAQIRKGFYDHAEQMGANIDLGKLDFDKAQGLLDKWKKTDDPALRTMVEGFGDMLDSYKKRGTATLADVSSFKSQLANRLPDSAWDVFPTGKKLKPIAQEFKQGLASDLRDAIVETGNKADGGLGSAINGLNESWGPIIESQNPLHKEAMSALNPKSLGQHIDSIAIASGHPMVAAARNALEVMQSGVARRALGTALISAGQSGLADATARRLVDQYRK